MFLLIESDVVDFDRHPNHTRSLSIAEPCGQWGHSKCGENDQREEAMWTSARCFSAVVLVGVVAIIAACSRDSSSSDGRDAVNQGQAATVVQARQSTDAAVEYFPHQAGTVWKYSITIGEVEPLYYRVVSCGDSALELRSRFGGLVGPSRKTYQLEMRVKGRASRQGPLSDPDGVELEVSTDELGVFADHKQMFWATADTSAGRAITEVLTFEPGGGGCGHLGDPQTTEGHSRRIIFFAKPRNEIRVAGSMESLTSFDPSPEGRFKLVRTIEASPDSKESGRDHLSEEWTEELLFSSRGLERLIQRFGDRVSMQWDLVSFAAGDGGS